MTKARLEVAPAEVYSALSRYHLVDVRETSEFEGPLGHITGAESIVLSDLERRAPSLPRDRPLLMVCRSGARSGMACDALPHWGGPEATNLVGGMIDWHARGFPVVRTGLETEDAILEAFTVWLSQVRRMPLEEARAFVQERDSAADREGEVGRGAEALESTGEVVAGRITRLEERLNAEADAPADLALVCDALRGDAAALGTGASRVVSD